MSAPENDCHRHRGAGNNGARKHVRPFSLLNISWRKQGISVAITDRMAAWRRERRVLLRVSRAAWRLDQAERERSWALASARAEGVSIRALAAAVRLSSSRVHQIVAAVGIDELDATRVSCGRRAGRRRKTPMAMMTRNWTAGTPSRAGSSMRWAGFGSAPAG